ncbi:hypothetical protein ABPG72_003574 [Tetrahymena utriculariae]
MVQRRSPNSRWRNKIQTFSLVILAGTIHRFKSLINKYLNMNQIQKLAEKDSPFLPENMKALYQKNKQIIQNQFQYNDQFLTQFKQHQEEQKRRQEIINKMKTYEMQQKQYVLKKFLKF